MSSNQPRRLHALRKRILALGVLGALVFVAGVLLGAGVVYLLHRAHQLGDKPKPQPAAFSPVPSEKARELAEQFRPWLLFDKQERWRPLNVSLLLDEQDGAAGPHQFCTRPPGVPGCKAIGTAHDFDVDVHDSSAFGSTSYLDLAGNEVGQYHAPHTCPALLDCGSRPGSAMYFHAIQSNDRYYVDYWWFLRFNNYYLSDPRHICASKRAIEAGICDEHEGDWEGVTVVTPPGRDDAVDYVVYAAHKGTFRYVASELHMKFGRRAEVFVSRGSHASYTQACDKTVCPQPVPLAAGGLVTLPESRFNGKSPWERNGEDCAKDVPTSCLQELPRPERDRLAWTVWPGQWGAGCSIVCGGRPGVNSPQSPGLQQRYQTPWCSSQSGALTCDGRALGCSDWLGPLVAVVACTPKSVGEAQTSNDEQKTGSLKISVVGRDDANETTPGIAQMLGDPLQSGEHVVVSGGASTTQVLVRARQENAVVEAHFARVGLGAGRRAIFTVQRGTNERLVLLKSAKGSGDPDELRISRVLTAGSE